MLDFFALLILLVLLAAIALLGALPGYIARRRSHPQADAINVGGWVGLLFGGVLWPIALVWAYTRPIAGGSAQIAAREENPGHDRVPDPAL